MRNKAIIAFAGLALAGVLAGCSSGKNTLPSTTTTGFLFMVGPSNPSILGFKTDASGAFSPLTISSFQTGLRPISLVITPSKKFIYVANSSANSVGGYSIDGPTRILTPIGTALPPTPVGTLPISLAINSSGQFLYALNQGSSDISGLSLDSARGLMTPISASTFPTAATPTAMAISPNAGFLYVSNATTIATFAIAANGLLTASGAPVLAPAGSSLASITIDPKGTFLYASDAAHNSILSYSIAASGVLTAVAGSPFATGTQPAGIAIDSTDTFLFVANQGSNNVSAFKINAGVLTPVAGSPFATGSSIFNGLAPVFPVVDATNKFLYVGSSGSPDVAMFSINSTSGALAPITNSPLFVSSAISWILATN
jgi:6-phosphogluconolactonase (cycloisomerase 2 family)